MHFNVSVKMVFPDFFLFSQILQKMSNHSQVQLFKHFTMLSLVYSKTKKKLAFSNSESHTLAI